ncbi:MAG: hypothetical protein CME31_07030 [Gimesia sp.]|uniref:DUF4064 domain-containing protein n=1 Tax=Gimesia maris TaxID=122 RepID=A0A3D3R084_9PLAN|nr:hypothetical protein [Gimesia sp.]HCO22235.1 hypothetical protein [Gimesia maris]|tara:strand:- start:68232 stop:68693 length:462 start_codon:yes stop_codon:yes gene_type:complete
MSKQTDKFDKQLKVAGVLFMVLAGFCLLGLLLLPLHYVMMQSVMESFEQIDFPKRQDRPDPRQMIQTMQPSLYLMYGFMGTLGLLFGGMTLVTGINLYRKTRRTVCIIGSAAVCIWFPIGTALGVWTLLILFDKQAQPLFEAPNLLAEDDFLS